MSATTTTTLLPRAILPLLVACFVASVLVHFARGYLCPSEDLEDRRRSIRETVFCFLAAVLACFSWHVVGPFSDRWHYLLAGAAGGTTDAFDLMPAAGVPVPVDTAMPMW